MKKIPVPVAIAVVILVVALAGFMIFRSSNEATASGDVNGVIREVMQSKPQNVPKLPPGIDPTKGAMGMGAKKGKG